MKRFFNAILLSRVVAAILLIAVAVLAWILPLVVESVCGTRDLIGDRANLTEAGQGFILAVAYLMLAVAALAILLLWRLLGVVSRGAVFSEKTPRLLAWVALCCFGEAALFLSLVYWFQLALGAVLAASFVGLCLWVVRSVLSEACRIKAENDYTI